MRDGYHGLLDWCLNHRLPVLSAFALFVICSLGLATFIGRDFFPTVDSGQMRLHARMPAGTRLEETEHIFTQVEALIRNTVPKEELHAILDNIGLGTSGTSVAYADPSMIGPGDGEVLVSLNPEHAPTADYVRKLRVLLKRQYPDVTCFFLPSDIVSQILNFGLPAPIDVQIVGRDFESNYAIARQMLKEKLAAERK